MKKIIYICVAGGLCLTWDCVAKIYYSYLSVWGYHVAWIFNFVVWIFVGLLLKKSSMLKWKRIWAINSRWANLNFLSNYLWFWATIWAGPKLFILELHKYFFKYIFSVIFTLLRFNFHFEYKLYYCLFTIFLYVFYYLCWLLYLKHLCPLIEL